MLVQYRKHATLGILASSMIVAAGCLADIRPPAVSSLDLENPPSADALERGKALLGATAAAHGLAAWRQHRTTSARVADDWYGTINRLLTLWPAGDVLFDIVFENGKSAVRVEFLQRPNDAESEELAGLVWGVQNWNTYRHKKGAPGPEFLEHKGIRFTLPTVQYFISLPFRLIEAPIALDTGKATIDGKTYNRVFVTWGSVEANDDYDQYLIYIDEQTGLIAKAEFTVREIMPFATGAMHFDDYRQVDGVTVAFRQTITSTAYDSEAMHRIIVKRLVFDETSPVALYPRPELSSPKHRSSRGQASE